MDLGLPTFTTSGSIGLPPFTTSGSVGGLLTFTTSGSVGELPTFTTSGPNKRGNDGRQDNEDSDDEAIADSNKATSSFSFSSLAATNCGFNFSHTVPQLDTSNEDEDEKEEEKKEEDIVIKGEHEQDMKQVNSKDSSYGKEESEEGGHEEKEEDSYMNGHLHGSDGSDTEREDIHPPLLSNSDELCGEDVVFLYEDIPSNELIQKAENLMLPNYFYNYLLKPHCSGCLGCDEDFEFPSPCNPPTTPPSTQTTPTLLVLQTTPTNQPTPVIPSNDAPPTGESGLFSFADLAGESDGKSDFIVDKNFKFSGAGQQLFTETDENIEDAGEGDDPEREVNIHFKNLPQTYEYKSGEEGGEVLFNEKCKLYRFDPPTKQWKERGVGTMKIIYYPASCQTRLLMRRDQILKLCCNHYITSDMSINCHFSNPKALTWLCRADYLEETSHHQQFTVRFKQEATASHFKHLFIEATIKGAEDILSSREGM